MSMPPSKDVLPVAAPGKTHADNETGLMKSWSNILHIIDAFTDKLCGTVFNNVKRHILDKIISAAGRNARLNGYDEKIYDYYKHLMDYYETVVGLYEDNQRVIVTPGVKRIVDGIYDVLSLQYRQFLEGQDQTAENPVTKEKKGIIITSVNFFTTNFEKQRTIFVDQYLWEGVVYGRRQLLSNFGSREALSITHSLTDMIKEYCYDSFYADYHATVMLCYDRLNDLHSRKSTSYYYELLEKERDILGTIIKVQAAALERETAKPSIEAGEKALVQNILTVLREGYQYYGREAKEIMVGFHDAESAIHNLSIENYEAFIASLKAFTSDTAEQGFPIQFFNHCGALYQEKLLLFKIALLEEAKRVMNIPQVFSKNVYGLQKKISEQVLMSGEMVQAFQRLIDFFSNLSCPEELMTKPEYAIMKGISETIGIKIESLHDATLAFTEDSNEIIAQLICSARDEIRIADEELQSGAELLYDRWKVQFADLEDIESAVGDITNFINECLAEKPFISYRQRVENIQTQYQDRINKKVMGFKREHILFEVSTYEEINQYSVSRLLESEDEIVSAVVAVTKEVTEVIGTILKKNNIAVINPSPHDMFNGKEHEVLMAEKNAEYKKGEIIKLMNSGYKQYDVVILRANVIAAK